MNLLIKNRTKKLLGLCLLSILLGGCIQSKIPFASNPSEASPTNPLFSQSKIAIASNFKQTTVIEGLEHPWSMAWLRDDTVLITERPGRLRIVRNGVLEPQEILGLPEIFAAGQGGLLDISVHPDFQENRLIYLTYAHGQQQDNRTRVARAVFDGKALQNLEIIFEVDRGKQGTQHFGSRMIWLPDKTMLVAFGDGGNPPLQLNGDLIRKQAQNLRSRLGKIVRLNDDGSIPQDNPFIQDSNADPALWSYGHRNIQGMAFDSFLNRVWATEHGSRGGDELNLITSRQNYGWPEVSYSDEYRGGKVSEINSRPDVPEPKVVWTPSIAPSGLTVYRGGLFQEWQGNILAGGLVSKDIRRLELDAEGNVLKEESIPIGERVRDVRQSPDGVLYVLTDSFMGRLVRIDPIDL